VRYGPKRNSVLSLCDESDELSAEKVIPPLPNNGTSICELIFHFLRFLGETVPAFIAVGGSTDSPDGARVPFLLP